MKYCSECGSTVRLAIPPDDERKRHICDSCGHIHYQNPNIIAGCLPLWKNSDGKLEILLCKRAIAPRKGLWTLPAGFLENGESVEEGALRETLEEANAAVDIVRLLSVTSLPDINQVYMIYLANLKNKDFFPGAESLDVKLVKIDNIIWDTIAFNAIEFAMRSYLNNPDDSQAHCNIITKIRT